MFHFTDSQCRIVRAIAHRPDNAKLLSNARFIVLEHILPTTQEFLRHLKDVGSEVFAVIAKPYSIHEKTLQEMKEDSFRIVSESYDTLEKTDLLRKLILEAINRTREDKKQIVLLDIGGYFAESLRTLSSDERGHIAGVVEDTTFGHNRYTKLREQIEVPMASVARSELKEIEARFVGRDAVHATDHVLREIGISLTGRNALVIGYGMIGKHIARTLRRHDLNVYVYDLEDYQILKAFADGFHIHKKVQLLRYADIIFSATGSWAIHNRPAMSLEEIEDCKNNVVLASVGSKDVEFDIAAVRHQSHGEEKLSERLVRYKLGDKHVIVANNGTAVNFLLPSIPREVMDLVFAEILELTLSALRMELPKGMLQQSTPSLLNKIAKG
ncbi:MAG: adenosylhomocysteinase, partial [Nitrososphaera sp.]|nr:adenosylhomocysteinase [Nitrososphaera sp.]